jgi:hypothetical protein
MTRFEYLDPLAEPVLAFVLADILFRWLAMRNNSKMGWHVGKKYIQYSLVR